MHPILFFTNLTLTVVASFLLSGLFIRRMTSEEIEECNKLEQDKIELVNLKCFQYMFLDDLVELSEQGQDVTKDVFIEIDVPFNKIKMYHQDGSFVYYTRNGDVPYKYVNVACRKFVIEHNCRHLYLDDDINDAIKYALEGDDETKEEEHEHVVVLSPLAECVEVHVKAMMEGGNNLSS